MNSPILFLFLVFAIGVFGDTDGQNSVSVMEGDSVTLHSGVSEIQSKDTIEWKFAGNRLAKISSGRSSIEEAFGNRLQLDNQTGDLKITNIKTTNSGEYTLKIRSSSGSSDMTFNVNVVSAGVKSVSGLEGDSVTLRTDPTDIQRDDVIRWRFDHQNSPVAEIDKTAGILKTYDGADGRFRHRLQLEYWTGSLTIKNIGTSHSGLYEVDIISTSRRYTIHKSFSVTISDDGESVSVMVGDSVILHTSLTKIQTDDEILWKFGDHDEIIADLNGPVNKKWTGHLIISNIQRNQSGRYKVEINTRRVILHRKYNITMIDAVKSVSVKEGETVTLQTNVTEIQKDDQILWMFRDIDLAEINKVKQLFYGGPDKRFRGRLELDHQTGSLNITDTRTTDSGLYELKISSSRRTINRGIIVTVTAVPDSGLSPAAVAGIVVGVGVILMAAAVVVAAVLINHRRKISELERQKENGQNHKNQDTDDPANEETKLSDP